MFKVKCYEHTCHVDLISIWLMACDIQEKFIHDGVKMVFSVFECGWWSTSFIYSFNSCVKKTDLSNDLGTDTRSQTDGRIWPRQEALLCTLERMISNTVQNRMHEVIQSGLYSFRNIIPCFKRTRTTSLSFYLRKLFSLERESFRIPCYLFRVYETQPFQGAEIQHIS